MATNTCFMECDAEVDEAYETAARMRNAGFSPPKSGSSDEGLWVDRPDTNINPTSHGGVRW